MTDATQILDRMERSMPEPRFSVDAIASRRRRRANRRRIEAAVVALTLVAVVSAGLASVLGRTSETNLSAGAAGTLPEATSSVPALGDGEYSFTQARIISAGDIVLGPLGKNYRDSKSTTWWGTDGSGALQTDDRQPDVYVDAGSLAEALDKSGLMNLPTDPDGLRGYLLDNGAFNGSPVAAATASPGQSPESVRVTRMVGDILGYGVLSPQQRVALVEVLSNFVGDGVTVGLDATDPGGRAAYLLSFETTSGPTRYDVYVDPATHDVLAFVERIPRSGQVTFARIVDAVGITPTLDVPGGAGWLPPAGETLDLQTDVSQEYMQHVEDVRTG